MMRRGDEDQVNIVSGDEDEEGEESFDLFAEGQPCDACGAPDGRIGVDPTCRGAYDGDPKLYCTACAVDGLRAAYERVEGVSVIVEPFGEFGAHYYYRLDEMPAYQFVREDVEGVSWLMLTVGDDCARCGEQSRHAWLPRESVDERLPENRALFSGLDQNLEHLCNRHAAEALAEAYVALKLPLLTVEVPRSAMGVLMPTGD